MSEKSTEKNGHDHVQQSDVEYQAAPPRRKSRLAPPGAMGLFSFASTTFLLSMYNVNARGITSPNVVVGMAAFSGGLVQLLAGMWEVVCGNLFGATAFSLYGSFWMSYALILIPGSGIIAAYEGHDDELHQALGMFLITWFMITMLFILPVMRRSIAFTVLLSVLALALLLLAVGEWNQMPSVNKAGGGVGIITGLVAFYIGVAELMAAERTAVFRLPLGILSQD